MSTSAQAPEPDQTVWLRTINGRPAIGATAEHTTHQHAGRGDVL